MAPPSSYKPKYCKEIVLYFEKARDIFNRDEVGIKSKRLERPSSKKAKTYNYKSQRPLIILPTLERYSTEVGVTTRTLQRWKNTHPEFGEAVKQCMAIQKEMLLQMGLNGYYNANLVKMILCNNHGWTNKEEVVSKGTFTIKFDKQDKNA